MQERNMMKIRFKAFLLFTIAKVLFIQFRKNLFLSFPKKSLQFQFAVTDYKHDWAKK